MANSKKKIVFGATAGVGALVSVILSDIYKVEGGYVNNPKDRGGETNHGVTISVAREKGYTGSMKDFSKECYTEEDVCADKIYYTDYIVKPGFLPILQANEPIGAELVDTGVNMGPYYGGRFLQLSLNTKCAIGPKLVVDGKIGKGTLTRFNQCQTNIGKLKFCQIMLADLDAQQKARYDAIVKANPSQKIFYKGWINKRIGNVDPKTCKA